jgi:hypothetical protein
LCFIQGLLFHSFPVDQHRFDLWRQTVLNHCSRTISINKHSKICHRHFHPDDYIANHTGLTRYLKATAIPSIFTEIHSDLSILQLSNFHTHPLSMAAIDCKPNRSVNICAHTTETSSAYVLPVRSSSPTTTNTKASRLLSTIDKLYQIQNNANKMTTSHHTAMNNESMKINTEKTHGHDESIVKITTTTDEHELSTEQTLPLSNTVAIKHDEIRVHQNPMRMCH